MPTIAERQKTKERAMLLALQQDCALYRNELELRILHKDGTSESLVQGSDYDHLWEEGLAAAKQRWT